ncbi:MAG: phage major capsid protein [Chloroflexota bacterium]
MFKSTPRERDAMALAAKFGVDVREVGRVYNDATADLLDKITFPDSPADMPGFLAENRNTLFANPTIAAQAYQKYAEKWAASNSGQDGLRQLDNAAAQGAAGAAMPAALDQRANAEAFKLLQNLMNGGTQDRDKLQRLNLDPRTGAADSKNFMYTAGGINDRAPGSVAYNDVKVNPKGHKPGAGMKFGDWLVAAGPAHINDVPKSHREYRATLEDIRDAYSGTVPADGGFLVPEEFRAELLALSLEQSIVRSRARVIPMGALKLRMPTIDSNTNVGSVNGGMVAYWTEESADLVESQARFGSVLLEAQKLTGLSAVPNELLMDAPGFEAFVMSSWPEALRFFEDIAYIRGSGVGEPLGYLANSATVVQTAVSGQGANTIKAANIFAMYARMLPSSVGRAVWVVAQNAMPQLFALAAADNSPLFINNIAGGGPVTILGRPVIFTEKVNALGAQGDISFVDLGMYLIGDRMTMQMARSEHARFTRDQTMFRIISRSDGRPWLNTSITPVYGGNDTLSPFVELNASRT